MGLWGSLGGENEQGSVVGFTYYWLSEEMFLPAKITERTRESVFNRTCILLNLKSTRKNKCLYILAICFLVSNVLTTGMRPPPSLCPGLRPRDHLWGKGGGPSKEEITPTSLGETNGEPNDMEA
jgi:hypothetical protein